MVYAIYRISEDEPNVGYLWGAYTNPKRLATSSFELAKTGVYAIKVLEYSDSDKISDKIEV